MCLFFIAKALHSNALLCYIFYLLETPASLSRVHGDKADFYYDVFEKP